MKKIELLAVQQTKQWLEEIIIGLNFCPFAKKEFVNNTIDYVTCSNGKIRKALEELLLQCNKMDADEDIETSLIIYIDCFRQFEKYLDLVDYANELLIDSGYEGIYQLATFHPDYCFEGEDFDSASNFTNRSPYPTLHIIREKSMEKVLKLYPNPEQIPENNIELAESKGNDYFTLILDRILNEKDK